MVSSHHCWIMYLVLGTAQHLLGHQMKLREKEKHNGG